jgi:hypothetical protein
MVGVSGTLTEDTYSATTSFYVADSPQGCPTPTLTPSGPVTVPAGGASYTIQVTGLPANCKWTIQLSDDIITPWITSNPLAGLSFSAPGSFTLTAASNGGAPAGRQGGAFVSAGPNLNGVVSPPAQFEMTQPGSPYSVSGTVTLPGRMVGDIEQYPPLAGVTIHFQQLTGTGTVPADVVSNSAGAWTATGFTENILATQSFSLANTYSATASKAGYTITPASYQFGGQANPLLNVPYFTATPIP